MKVGDRVTYHPTILSDSDIPIEDTVITKFEYSGSIFNQHMAVIEGVDHWVPAYDLTPIGEKPINGTITLEFTDGSIITKELNNEVSSFD